MEKKVPVDDHDKAMALMTKLLDTGTTAAVERLGFDDDQQGALLGIMTLSMHTLVVALNLRPHMMEPFLDSLEALMIEGEITKKDAPTLRRTSEQVLGVWWANVDTWTKPFPGDKLDA